MKSMMKIIAEYCITTIRLNKSVARAKAEFERRVLKEAERKMKINKSDMDEILLEKYKKDSYAKQVILCNNHLSLGNLLRVSGEKQLKEKLAEVEEEVERAKTEINRYRKKKWRQKAIKKKDITLIKMLFPARKKINAECEDNDKILEVARLT